MEKRNKNKHYKLSISYERIDNKEITIMNVVFVGTPGIGEVISLMKEINTMANGIKGDYISVTDFTKLSINKLLRSIILHGMEATYKSLLSVKHPALYSFVVLGSDNSKNSIDTLESINQKKSNGPSDYNYRYVFVKSADEVSPIIGKLLAKS